jgi:hypothetical protein
LGNDAPGKPPIGEDRTNMLMAQEVLQPATVLNAMLT